MRLGWCDNGAVEGRREAAEAILYVVLVLFGAIKGMFNLKVGWSHNEKC